LASKQLNVRVGEWCETVTLEKVKDALAVEISDNANMISEIEAVAQMNALVPVFIIIVCQSREHAEFYSACITIFLHRTNNLDGTFAVSVLVPGLDDFAKGALSKKFQDFI
jgi:hypothetical protein